VSLCDKIDFLRQFLLSARLLFPTYHPQGSQFDGRRVRSSFYLMITILYSKRSGGPVREGYKYNFVLFG